MTKDGDRIPSLAALEEAHAFPGRYVIKVFGPVDAAWVAQVVRAADEVTGLQGHVRHSVRESSGGKHACVTLDVYVQTAHQVQAIYAELLTLPAVRMLL